MTSVAAARHRGRGGGTCATTFVTARTVFGRSAQRREQALQALADRLESLVRDLVATLQALPRRDMRRT